MKNKIAILYYILGVIAMVGVILVFDAFLNKDNESNHNHFESGDNSIDNEIKDIYKNGEFSTEVPDNVPKYAEYGNEDIYWDNSGVLFKDVRYELLEQAIVKEDDIGDKVGDFSEIDNDVLFELHEIKNISRNFAVAVKGNISEKFVSYVNPDYKPENVEQFFKDIDITNNSEYMEVHMAFTGEKNGSIVYYEGFEEWLINDLKKITIKEDGEKFNEDRERTGLSILIRMKGIDEAFTMIFMDNGDIWVKRFCGNSFYFPLGKKGLELGNKIISQLSGNGKAYVVNY